jgi:NAD(P)-dependent dehydrogenase (short-subunit alcohol dehydrogenase family)
MRLRDKVAIITGAGSGIGRAIALGFAAEGASVIVSDINAEGAAAVAAEVGGAALANTCDVSDPEQVEAMVAAAIERFGKIDILVNNAGYAWGGPLARTSLNGTRCSPRTSAVPFSAPKRRFST